jgi:hypothetical protein
MPACIRIPQTLKARRFDLRYAELGTAMIVLWDPAKATSLHLRRSGRGTAQETQEQ